MSANPLVVSLSHLLKPHEEQHELKKDLIGQVVKLIVENEKLKEENKWWGEEDKDKLDTIQELEKHTWDLESDLEELKEEKGKLKREVMEVQGKLNFCLASCEEYRGEIRDLKTKLEQAEETNFVLQRGIGMIGEENLRLMMKDK